MIDQGVARLMFCIFVSCGDFWYFMAKAEDYEHAGYGILSFIAFIIFFVSLHGLMLMTPFSENVIGVLSFFFYTRCILFGVQAFLYLACFSGKGKFVVKKLRKALKK